jgi:hypothetical protein
MRTFLGEVAQPEQLDEASEKDLVGRRDGRALLVPYRSLDLQAEPYVLIHGIHDAPVTLRTLADKILAKEGRQVFFLLYDDSSRYLDRTGDDLANALVEIALSTTGPIRLVAHSMGGVVARAAMNSLVMPNWMPTRSAINNEPLRGAEEALALGIRLAQPMAHVFRRLDLIAIDTPWHGFTDVDVEVRNKMDRQMSYVDVVASSTLLRTLTQVDLPAHFTINQIEADNAAGGKSQDKVLSLGEIDDEAMDALMHYFSGDNAALTKHKRLENQIRALEDEADGPALIAALREKAAAGQLDRATYLEWTARAVPRLAGCHLSILDNPDLVPEIERTFDRCDA